MSDLVINVKQIGSYPPLNPITGTEMLLVQSGGLGGPYYSVQMSAMIVNTLENFDGPIAIGVGQAPADGNPDTIFSGDVALTLGPLGVAFNAYSFEGGGASGYKYWQNGLAGSFFQDPVSGNFAWQAAPVGQAGAPIFSTSGGPTLFTIGMTLSPAGYLQLVQTLLVGRNPTLPLEVATKGYVDSLTGPTNVVTSWNARDGNVILTLTDVENVGGAPLNNPYFTGVPQAPTPALGTNTNQIATTAWVLDQISAVSAGVITWNGRSGVVTMTQADITSAGGLTIITANATYLALSGGTMAGPITMSAGAVANMDVPVLGQVGARVGANTPPATPNPLSGNLWWDSAGAQLYAWTGAEWVIAVNPPIPNTANFLPLSGGTLTGNLSVPGTTGYFSLPATAILGTTLGRVVTSVSNLTIAAYADTSAVWRQLPGTGTGGTQPQQTGGAIIGSNNAGVIISWAAPAADEAALSLTELATFTPNQTSFSGGIYTQGVANVGSLQFGVLYPSGPVIGFNSEVDGWGGASGPNFQTNINGGEYAVVLGFNQDGTWYPWVNVQTAGGGVLAAANIANAGPGYQVTWPTNNNSDRRLKSNIADPSVDAIATVNALQVHQADMSQPRPDQRSPDHVHYDFCFIADEVEKVVPQAVCKHPEPEKGYDILNPLHLVPVLWKAVQDLSAKVAALEGAR